MHNQWDVWGPRMRDWSDGSYEKDGSVGYPTVFECTHGRLPSLRDRRYVDSEAFCIPSLCGLVQDDFCSVNETRGDLRTEFPEQDAADGCTV